MHDYQKSIIVVFVLARGAISWNSAKQTIITSSTINAEPVVSLRLQLVVAKLFRDLMFRTDIMTKSLKAYVATIFL